MPSPPPKKNVSDVSPEEEVDLSQASAVPWPPGVEGTTGIPIRQQARLKNVKFVPLNTNPDETSP